MRVVAKKAQGSKRIVAPRPPMAMTPEAFANAFGATPVGTVGDDYNPFSLLQLREELERRLRSTGGRPALADVAESWKVGVFEEDAPAFRELAAMVSTERYKASPAQIVCMMAHMALRHFSLDEIRTNFRESSVGMKR